LESCETVFYSSQVVFRFVFALRPSTLAALLRCLPMWKRNTLSHVLYLFFIGIALISLSPIHAVTISGELQRWHKLTLNFDGPATDESAEPNPFTDYRLTVTFKHVASGELRVVPGFFAADGKAAESSAEAGSVWRVYFSPPFMGSS
jgi:hypothetical protein